MEEAISAYLRAHPDRANALNVSAFRFLRQVTVGMDQEQVMILLGAPVEVRRRPDAHRAGGAPLLAADQGNATAVWVYLEGWAIYFAGQNVVDITQYLPPGV